VITPRSTRLICVPSLGAFRQTILDLTAGLDVQSLRACAILVPSHAAAEYLRRTLESSRLPGHGAIVLPHLLTRHDWLTELFHHLPGAPTLLSPHERDVLLGASAYEVRDAGTSPPFSLRPGLIGELLTFYDTLRRQLRTVDDFDRLATARFARDAEVDRGAARLLAQTRFMVDVFRTYDRRLASLDRSDEHVLREWLLAQPNTPLRHVIVTVGDRTADPAGLFPADFDLLARLDGVARIDVVATEASLAAGYLQRIRDHLPGIDESPPERRPRDTPLDSGRAVCASGSVELRGDRTGEAGRPRASSSGVDEILDGPDTAATTPVLVTPNGANAKRFHVFRDREDELRWIARRIKHTHRREPALPLARTAVVFKRPLPYVYLASQVFPSAGVPHETFDALPLASEAFAAAVDLLIECVETSFTTDSVMAVTRSPHFRVNAACLGAELAVLDQEQPPSVHLDTMLGFLQAHERVVACPDAMRQRPARARAAVLSTLASLRDAHRRFDDRARPFAETAADVRRWFESQTFAPQSGNGGVPLVDVHAARYADVDTIYVVGMIQREWPDATRRNIFFPGSLLQDLGWPSDADARAAERAGFRDLLHLPARHVLVSAFTLEDDAIVEPSPFLEDLVESRLEVVRATAEPDTRVSLQDALAGNPVCLEAVTGNTRRWLDLRLARTPVSDARYHGQAGPAGLGSYTVSTLDRYVECPFICFAEQVLGIKDEPEDDEGLGPREQGKVVHDVFRRFFEVWQTAGHAAITADRFDAARRLFADVVDLRLGSVSDNDAAILRTRLIGSPVAPGLGDIVFGIEAERLTPVTERLLEFSLTGETELRAEAGVRTINLRATADRLDLLADGTFWVLDYKLSHAPDTAHAVQLPAYAAAARARLAGRHGVMWWPSNAAYVAFGKAPYYRPLVRDPDKLDAALAAGEARLAEAVDRIEGGDFPPRPRQRRHCEYCAFSSVCRKDYVDER
jgi:RecB family exonuclease